MAKEIAMMKRLLEEAGIKPIPEVESLVEIDVEKCTNDVSFIRIHEMCDRVLPEIFLLYRHALLQTNHFHGKKKQQKKSRVECIRKQSICIKW